MVPGRDKQQASQQVKQKLLLQAGGWGREYGGILSRVEVMKDLIDQAMCESRSKGERNYLITGGKSFLCSARA